MKKQLIFSLTLLTLVLAACGGQSTPTPPEAAEPTQAAAQPTIVPTSTVAATEAAPATDTVVPATEVSTTAGVSFANDVLPILTSSCADCHGGNQTKAGLDLTKYESLMAGSFDGTVITTGNAAESLLIQMSSSGKMPKRGSKLTADQIQIISDWINAGALNN